MKNSFLVEPLKVFGTSLNGVQSPSRYIGGEFKATVKPHSDSDGLFNFAVAFPDLYEIAMSNLAVKIIYNGLNQLGNVRCERVFAPDVDFEKLLRENDVPLYTLETGIPLFKADMIGFSIGYELGITEVLAMLDLGKIHLLACERSEFEPIVIAGGCGVTNPAPFSDFFDAVFIGEAEPALFSLVEELSLRKKEGASRKELIELMESKPFIWTKRKHLENKTARRAVQADFGLVRSVPSWFPLPSCKPVQDHGVVEIMRGCPNGCRFCHAGIYYRPMRVKNRNLIIEEIDHLVFDAGYREISLNSLSSADFPDVSGLLDELNERYKGLNVSFQLPSLKVNAFSLDILEKLSKVRRSGLTFAVETPDEMWQLSLNKEVYASHLEEIIREAKSRGWSSAKFYFMVGLPLGDYFSQRTLPAGAEGSEEKAIVDFMLDLQSRVKIQCNVNVGVFIPKPHTPYERVKQIDPKTAEEKIEYIFRNLPRGKFKMSRHNYNATVLEGLLSRGDFRAGSVILNAYKKGVRFDAWDDYLQKGFSLWKEAFAEADFDVEKWIFRNWDEGELPWKSVSLGPSSGFYEKEWKKSIAHELTEKCTPNCTHKCGVCNKKENTEVFDKDKIESALTCLKNNTVIDRVQFPECNIPVLYRVIFNFSRKNGGEFIAYLSQVEIFHKAVFRSGLDFVFTSGFNPLPRLEFATAMTLGIPSHEESASCLLYTEISSSEFVSKMNSVLPSGLQITEAFVFPVTNLRKRESLSQGLWGGVYRYSFFNDPAAFAASRQFREFAEKNPLAEFDFKKENLTAVLPVSDKALRQAMESFYEKKWYEVSRIEKLHTLAKNEVGGWTVEDEDMWRRNNRNFVKSAPKSSGTKPVSYMELYSQIARVNIDLINKRAEF
ncbi:TIGR03960 family B12-binding radical SAM protein [Treponema sp.]|uniref:TIGR03960 family B12-binding radical SAM protein n=1 Tax=Treponema sp. TaxID=166 RepID=UPI003F00BBC4